MKALFVGKKLHTPKVAAHFIGHISTPVHSFTGSGGQYTPNATLERASKISEKQLAACVQRTVEKWGPAEVHRWTTNAGLSSYADILADKGGMVRILPALLCSPTCRCECTCLTLA